MSFNIMAEVHWMQIKQSTNEHTEDWKMINFLATFSLHGML